VGEERRQITRARFDERHDRMTSPGVGDLVVAAPGDEPGAAEALRYVVFPYAALITR